MPAKRKASITQGPEDEPIATRRRIRTKTTSFSSETPSRNPSPRGVHVSPLSPTKGPVPKPPPESTAFSTPDRKGNDRRLTRSQVKASSEVCSKPPSGVHTSDREDDESDDELSFLPKRRATNKKPLEEVSAKVPRLPRVFVEIVSPAPRTPKHLTTNAITRLASPTPTRSRVIRRTSPSLTPSITPTKLASAKGTSPSKPLAQSALHADESGLSHGSSRYPPSCLYAQKRAILHALLHPNTAVFDREDENGEPSANAVALEQLKALLIGTLDRGEGNSCLLVGPRGSGKSRVSISASDISSI
jgi:origin recognition complex subunit 4